MNDNTFDWNLLARYFAGECSAVEADAVRSWVDDDPRRREEIELLECAWDIAPDLPTASALERMWTAVAAEAQLPPAKRPVIGRTVFEVSTAELWAGSSSRRRWAPVLTIAATLAVLVGGGAVAWLEFRGRIAPAARVEASVREFRTPRGQRGTMTLLDGTRVALGPESRLQVRMAEAGPRELFLEGEAAFDVVHDAARPFIVRTNMNVTEDLGTRFGVQAYHGESVRVVVSEGVVAVRDMAGNDAVMLAARDLLEMGKDGVVNVKRGVDPEAYLAWTTGQLVFRRVPLGRVLVQLERWFDVRVVVADSALLTATVSASFDDDDLDEVLRTLAGALGARADRRGRWVYLGAPVGRAP